MADVFVSYKAEDRTRVQPIVKALASEGLSVWWDAHIGAGAQWRDTIETELHAATCVVVVWSAQSVGAAGHFVRDEATRAQRRGAYLPVRIDPVDLPLGFGETQAISLIGWKGDQTDPRWQQTVQAIRTVIAGVPPPSAAPEPVRPRLVSRRTLLVAGGITACLGVSGWWYTHRDAGGARRLAVLPFANLSEDPKQLYLCDGLAEELRTALARLPGLEVIARISSEAVRGLDAIAAAAKLSVGTILSGSIRRSGSLVRITAQLVSAKSGVAHWSESYDRADQDALAIQSDIAERVAAALRPSLSEKQSSEVTSAGTSNAKAHDLYLRAREINANQDGEDSTREILSLAEAALALDPGYARAHAMKASALANLGVFYSEGEQRQARLTDANAAARRSIALDAKLADGYVALAYVLKTQFDFRGALENYRLANSFGDDSRAQIGSAFFLAEMGQANEAIAPASKATIIDPLNPNAFSAVGDVHYFAGRYEEAIVALRRMSALAPNRYYAHYFIGLSLTWLHRFDEAQAEFGAMPIGDAFRAAGEVVLAIQRGDRETAEQVLAPLIKAGPSVLVAALLAQRGSHEEALTMLESAWIQRDPDLSSLRCDRMFDPLRKLPRFAGLVKKLNFP